MVFDSRANFWLFRPPKAWWSQTRRQRSTSRSLALIYFVHLVERWEDYAMNFVIVIRGRQGETPGKSNRKKKSNAASTTSSTWLQLPNRREYHPLNSRQPRETLSGIKKRRTPCWICYNHLQKDYKNEMHLPQLRQPGVNFHMNLSKKNLVMRNFPRLSRMQGGCSG